MLLVAGCCWLLLAVVSDTHIIVGWFVRWEVRTFNYSYNLFCCQQLVKTFLLNVGRQFFVVMVKFTGNWKKNSSIWYTLAFCIWTFFNNVKISTCTKCKWFFCIYASGNVCIGKQVIYQHTFFDPRVPFVILIKKTRPIILRADVLLFVNIVVAFRKWVVGILCDFHYYTHQIVAVSNVFCVNAWSW